MNVKKHCQAYCCSSYIDNWSGFDCSSITIIISISNSKFYS